MDIKVGQIWEGCQADLPENNWNEVVIVQIIRIISDDLFETSIIKNTFKQINRIPGTIKYYPNIITHAANWRLAADQNLDHYGCKHCNSFYEENNMSSMVCWNCELEYES